MNDDRYDPICCNGNCLQGDKCPRYPEDTRSNTFLLALALVGWILFFCFVSGYLYAAVVR